MSYTAKQLDYFDGTRNDIISLIPKNPHQSVLEIGASRGNTLLKLKTEGYAREVVGLDLFAFEGSNQQHPAIDRFIVADIEKTELDLPASHFDVLIFADVLEHLVNPWEILSKMLHYLRPGGMVIISVPNIREITSLRRIAFEGSFRYDPLGGIFDTTHLRFFCRRDLINMIEGTGSLTLEKAYPIMSLKKSMRGRVNQLTLGVFEQFLTTQYVAVARKKHGPAAS